MSYQEAINYLKEYEDFNPEHNMFFKPYGNCLDFTKSLDTLQELIDIHDVDYCVIEKQNQDIKKLEKELDIACEELEDMALTEWCFVCKHRVGNKCEITKGECYEYCKKSEWKEHISKESEKQ